MKRPHSAPFTPEHEPAAAPEARRSGIGLRAAAPGEKLPPVRQHRPSSRERFRRFLAQQHPSPNSTAKAQGDGRGALEARRQPYHGSSYRRYALWIRPHVGLIGRLLLIALLGIGSEMLWPLLCAQLIDQVILNKSLAAADKSRLIFQIALGLVLLVALGATLAGLRAEWLVLLNSRFSFDLRRRLLRHVLRLSLTELNERTTGGILSRLSSDIDDTSELLQHAIINPALTCLKLVLNLAVVFTLNAKIAAWVALALPPLMLVQVLYARYLRPIWLSLSDDRQEVSSRIAEGLGGIRVVRSFRREKLEELAYTVGHHTMIRKSLLATRVQRRLATVWEVLLPLVQIINLTLGGYFVVQGKLTVGALVALQAYIARVFEPILQVSTAINSTQRGLAALDRVCELLDRPEEQPERTGTLRAPQQVADVSFEHVSFAYGNGSPVVQDLCLRVKAGSVVALVGPSGSGKTTVTDLLARFHNPTSGAIRLNGIDVRLLHLKSYRSLIAIVSQDVFLFGGTIADNIKYGNSKASSEEVARAARRANAHEFIERLPAGYHSVIGERGVKLSGGQRQRLSIARALLADPQILVLDEATSNLDTKSEKLIQQSLGELLLGRTTFVIAHRLSTITDADLIVVMEHGRAIEMGGHQELMHLGGAYHTMVQRQEGGD